jgi:hypothetical protein
LVYLGTVRAIRPTASNDQEFFAMITVGMNYHVIAGKQRTLNKSLRQ